MDNKSKRELFIMKKATENPKRVMDFITFMLNKYNINKESMVNHFNNIELFFNDKIVYKDDLPMYSYRKSILNRWANVYEYFEFIGVAAFVINIDNYKSEMYDFKDEVLRLESLFAISFYYYTPEVIGKLLFELACLYKNTMQNKLSESHAYEAINFFNIVKSLIRFDAVKSNLNISLIYKHIFNNKENYEKYFNYAYEINENVKEPVLDDRANYLLELTDE